MQRFNFKSVFVIFFLLMMITNVEAAKSYLKSQYAGEIGLISIGGGLKYEDYISLDLFYGVVPKSVENEKIETLAIKNHYQLKKINLFSSQIGLYTGISMFHVMGQKYQTSHNKKFPRNYYGEASLRGYFYVGTDFIPYSEDLFSLYFEMGVNDIWIVNYYNNPEVIDIRDHVSLGLGWSYRI